MTRIKGYFILGLLLLTPHSLQASGATGEAQQKKTLKISHQFPAGTIDEGDFRDRLCRKFAKMVEEKTNGSLKFEVYPSSSLMKTNAQFDAMRKGALDLSLVPISYSGGEVAEVNIGLMPCLVQTYEQGSRWREAEVGKLFSKILAEKGIVIVTWIWQAGGVAVSKKAKSDKLVSPEDAKNMKVRGGSKEMNAMLKEAGSAVIDMPSNDIYLSMQTGAMDAAYTSSSSLISFKLEELAKSLTTAQKGANWFMLEPLMISKEVFDKLSETEKKAIMEVGVELEKFAVDECKKDDQRVADIYKKAGAAVYDLSPKDLEDWTKIARETAWKHYAENSKCENCKKLIELAQEILKK